MWFLKQGIILTKDNLARWHWNGSQACCFWSKHETTQHLFFECHYVRFLWCSLHIVFGISPRNINHLFNDWAKLGGHRHNLKLLTSATTIRCTIWLTRNDSVFNNCHLKTFLQLLFREHIGCGFVSTCSFWISARSKSYKHVDF